MSEPGLHVNVPTIVPQITSVAAATGAAVVSAALISML